MNAPERNISIASDPHDFASLLRSWRRLRGMSQLSLALAADVSALLEVDRARPSRAMVPALTQTLDVPLRERNALLVAAGFAPMYKETPLTDAALEAVSQALDFMLSASEPHPCFIVNRRYDVVMANRTGRWLLETFTEDATLAAVDCNMVRLLVEPRGMAQFIVAPHAAQAKFRWDMARRSTGDVVSAGVGFLALSVDGRVDCDYLFTEA